MDDAEMIQRTQALLPKLFAETLMCVGCKKERPWWDPVSVSRAILHPTPGMVELRLACRDCGYTIGRLIKV